MDEAERQALRRAQAGELTQFTLLYERYVERVYRFVFFKTYHRETAEDLTSVTFMKALQHVRTFDPAKGSLASWLYRIAQNTVVDHWRTTKTELNVDDILSLASRENVAQATEVRQTLERVRSYLASLTPPVRDLLLMRLWQGLSYQEIAELTGKSEGALKMAVSRALKALRAAMPPAALLLALLSTHPMMLSV